MGVDWERLAGEGGAYLVERAAAVQQAGRLGPIGLKLVEEEARRLKYILSDEIARLEPSGELTAGAIEALRTHFQNRLMAAERVIASAQGMSVEERPLPSLPPQAGEGIQSGPLSDPPPQAGEGIQNSPLPDPPAQAREGGVEPPAPTLPHKARGGLREFFTDRSILILSYVGAFLLIVATLLFELSAFTAVDSAARFLGVFVLNLIFGLAGWVCLRISAMRLVGRSYVAIAALMVPLTLVAAWVFLSLEQAGLSRDAAIFVAGTSCALLYGALALRLESKGYALLSLLAIALAWGAGADILNVGRWRGTLLVLLLPVYLVVAHRSAHFKTFHAVFSGLADIGLHLAALGVIAWTLSYAVNLGGSDAWQILAVNGALASTIYVAYALLAHSPAGAAAAMVLFGATWVAALNVLDLEPLTGLLLTPLIAVYVQVVHRSRRVPGIGDVFVIWGEPFIHAATVLALGWTVYAASTVLDGSAADAWLLGAASLAVIALLYAWYATQSGKRLGGLAAMVALGLAWFCLLNGVELWPWRGLAFTPVMAFYIMVASRRPVIRDLFAGEPETLITGAGGVAVAWSIYATATSPDLAAAAPWYPTTVTLAVVAFLYGLDVRLRGDPLSPILSMLAFVGAWVAGTFALQLGDWRGPALTPLAVLFSAVAFRGNRLGSVGIGYARWAEPFVHGVAIVAIGWSSLPALADLARGIPVSQLSYSYLTATFGALTAGYAVFSGLSRRQSMQWAVAIGVTLTIITLNQALALSRSALAVEFLALAVGKAIIARFYRGTRMRTFLFAAAAAQALIAAAIPIEEEWLRAIILLAAGAMGVFMAVSARTPEWLYLAGAFFTYGWYWLLKVVIPPPPNPGPGTLVLMFSPLPVLYTAAALGLHRLTQPPWRWPLYAWAATVALGVAWLGVQQRETTVLGFALVAHSVAIYVATVLEDESWGVAAAGFSLTAGVFALLMAASAAAQWYPVAFTMLAWAIYVVTYLWDRPEWAEMHRFSGLALMGLTVLGCFAFIDFAAPGNTGAFTALAATWALSMMLAVDGRTHAMPALDYAALIVASFASYWLAHYLGATDPQWYVFAPGAALVTGGLLLHSDRRFDAPPRQAANLLLGIGAAALLGITALQTIDPFLSASLYTALLLCEAMGALLAGIVARNRVLVLAGAAGAALASLRALVILIQEIPLFMVFGLVAILLLGGAAALALLRARFADARVTMTRSWREWS